MLAPLNGPPASGKSTLAERLVGRRPLALDLDIDLVRGQLGGWLSQPIEAGLVARALAISMIDAHLGADRDVVVPQFLARPEFIEQLESAAARGEAEFVEIALDVSRAEAVSAFELRRQNPTRPTHQDAADLVDRFESADPVGESYDALQFLLQSRPGCHRVAAVRGDVERTLAGIVRTLADRGVDW